MSNIQNKTQATNVSPAAFIEKIADAKQKQDTEKLCKIMTNITGHLPIMWGTSIIGFDQYRYKYESDREGTSAALSFSPRKNMLVIYLADGVNRHTTILKNLGSYSTGKGCLYIKRLDDVDRDTLKKLLTASYTYVSAHKDSMGRAK
jgi:hypothetical protein